MSHSLDGSSDSGRKVRGSEGAAGDPQAAPQNTLPETAARIRDLVLARPVDPAKSAAVRIDASIELDMARPYTSGMLEAGEAAVRNARLIACPDHAPDHSCRFPPGTDLDISAGIALYWGRVGEGHWRSPPFSWRRAARLVTNRALSFAAGRWRLETCSKYPEAAEHDHDGTVDGAA